MTSRASLCISYIRSAFVLTFWLFISITLTSSGQTQPRAYVARSSPDVVVLDVAPASPNYNTVADTVEGTGFTSPPRPIAITPDGSRAYVTDQLSDAMLVIDTDPNSPNFNTVIATVEGVGLQALEVVITPDGSRAYVTNPDVRPLNNGNKLSVIDTDPNSPNFNTVIATVLEGVQPSGVAITPDGSRVYTVNSIGTASEIDTSTNTLLATINGLDINPRSIAITPDGSRAYVTVQYSGTVKVIDIDPSSASFNTVVDTIQLGIVIGLQTLIGIAITPDGSRAYAADRNKGLLVIDTDPTSPNFNTLVDTIGGVTLGGNGVSITPDDSRAYVIGGSSVVTAVKVIDINPNSPNFNTVVDTISIANNPTGIAITFEVPPDTDNDGFADGLDNCFDVANPDQTDTDGNGVGDACNDTEDADGDEWANNLDNCPNKPNGDQSDVDLDRVGDVCDSFPSDGDNEQAQCEQDLGQALGDVATCGLDLGQCQGDLGTAQTALQQALATIDAMRACLASYKKENGVRCRDDVDNDCDGLIDGDDPDCQK